MKIAHLSVLAALALSGQAAFAQSGPPSGPPPGFSGPPGSTTTTTTTTTGSGDAGNVTNIGSAISGATSTTDTMDSTTSTTGGELANTGGEPELMVMVGLFLAACGLLLYRRTSAQTA